MYHSLSKDLQNPIFYLHRLVHAFTAAGVLPSQYKRMCQFAEMGTVGKNYINKGNLAQNFCIETTQKLN